MVFPTYPGLVVLSGVGHSVPLDCVSAHLSGVARNVTHRRDFRSKGYTNLLKCSIWDTNLISSALDGGVSDFWSPATVFRFRLDYVNDDFRLPTSRACQPSSESFFFDLSTTKIRAATGTQACHLVLGAPNPSKMSIGT
jgi:hypothetical protein